MTTKIEGPWSGLITPNFGALSARRADPTHPFDFYYAVNGDGNLLLVLQLTESVDGQRDLPRLKGLRIQWIDQANSLQLVLAKGHDADLFALLCRDLLACTADAPNQVECFDRLCARLLRWQRLLSKGGPRLLDAQEIRGLFAELTFLQDELLPRFGPACVEAWKGPSGFPQDFAAANKVFEIKSHLVGSQQSVRISSPAQLWLESSALILCVYHLAVVPSGGQSLGKLVDQVASALSAHATASEEFEEKLASLGYVDLPDYRLESFAVVKLDCFEVTEGFPRIVPRDLMAGIHDVTYGIQLAALTPFLAPISWNET